MAEVWLATNFSVLVYKMPSSIVNPTSYVVIIVTEKGIYTLKTMFPKGGKEVQGSTVE